MVVPVTAVVATMVVRVAADVMDLPRMMSAAARAELPLGPFREDCEQMRERLWSRRTIVALLGRAGREDHRQDQRRNCRDGYEPPHPPKPWRRSSLGATGSYVDRVSTA